MGHLTPFGSRLEEFTEASSSKLPVEQDMVADVGGASARQGTLGYVAVDGVDSGMKHSSMSASPVLGVKEPKIRLSSGSFNGLFSVDSAEGPSAEQGLSGRKNVRRLARIPKKKDNDISAQQPSISLPTTDTLEPNDEIPLEDQDDWIPSLAQFMEFSSSSESEYFTDDDMGEVKGKKRLRELSSEGDLSSDDARGARPRKRGKGKMGGGRKRKKLLSSRYNDDGDEDMYRQRIR